VVRPPTSKGAFLYDDFEYCCNRCSTRCAVLSPGQSAAEQRDFAGLDRRAWRAGLWNIWLLLPLAIILVPFNFAPMRKSMISAPVFRAFRKVMPPMSRTEKEAIDAGTTWWEGDLFRGNPDWQKLHNYPQPRLTAEEQAFIDGPVEEACRMANDFQITHEMADLPPELWAYLKEHRFFAMIIKKEYGGLEFSAYAQARVLQKLSGVSGILAITVGVPNSLGPGELLQHYGTEEQKNHYLPRLARGQEIPCFALTSPEAGSDAGAIPDTGVVCMGDWQGEQVLGMRLTWNKRYITLAPIATVLGLAFKLSDPDRLLGGEEDLGITCALIPTNTPGVEIGRRHFPLNVPFQNGPTRGRISSCRSITSSAARKWPVRAGACWWNVCPWAAALPCRPTPPAA
jgi:acyl-CoA dehydrogenase